MSDLVANTIGGEELMKSQNFEFLRHAFPELADLGGFAERYVFADPASALLKLRLFAESMVSAIYSRHPVSYTHLDVYKRQVLTSSGLDALPEPQEGFDLNEYLAAIRQRLIDRALKRSDGNRSKAGQLLGVSPQAMSQYLRNRE